MEGTREIIYTGALGTGEFAMSGQPPFATCRTHRRVFRPTFLVSRERGAAIEFRTGSTTKGREISARLHDDSLLVLQQFSAASDYDWEILHGNEVMAHLISGVRNAHLALMLSPALATAHGIDGSLALEFDIVAKTGELLIPGEPPGAPWFLGALLLVHLLEGHL